MSEFMSYLRARPSEAEGDVFEGSIRLTKVLESLGNFYIFKELILSFKDEQEGKNLIAADFLIVSSHKE
jgi:hypothetical protein